MVTISTVENDWTPPGKNCGACGLTSCDEFVKSLKNKSIDVDRCPFYNKNSSIIPTIDTITNHKCIDITGQNYDFILEPMPGEPSARKIILPFRPDLTERMEIVPGDIVTGRPAGAGCPVQHVIRVIDADIITGVITGHVVGPAFSRNCKVKDVKEYHMLGFEGRATTISKKPEFGYRQSFLPGFCMMARAHTGLVNMVIDKPWGTQVRVEGIVIL